MRPMSMFARRLLYWISMAAGLVLAIVPLPGWLDPFRPEAPALAVDGPFYVFLFAALIAGVVLGGWATWMSQGHWRKSARHRAQDAVRWRSEADRLARERR